MKRFTAVLTACFAAALIASTPALAQVTPAPAQVPDDALKKDIEKLLEVTGASQMGVQAANMMAGQMLDSLRSNPSIPPRAIDVAKQVLDEEFKKAFAAPDGLLAGIVGVYAKHFTSDDVKGLVAFYNTDLGKKLIGRMPVLMQESVVVSQQWAEREMPRIGRLLDERLKKEGIVK